MSNVIKYIIINDKITFLDEHPNKLLFLYNYKSYYKLKWLIYAWSPLPNEIQKKIINIYDLSNVSSIEKLLESIFNNEHINIIKNTKKDIYEKTFIKFLYDLNYLNKNLLLLFTVSTKFYKNNPGFVFNNKYGYLKITKEEQIKIEKYKKNNVNLTNFYTEISFGFDKYIIKNSCYYFKELVKNNDEWWLITTGYIDKIIEDEESEKIIYWIFSQVI